MKTVINKSRMPIRIPLPRGKSLPLGPGRTAEIRDEATEQAAFQKLLEDGQIEVVEGAAHTTGAAAGSAAPHSAERARGRTKMRQRKGER